MSRRLRDARAAVKAPFRPETPYDVLQPGPSAPKKGSRLTALLSSGSAPSQLVSSTSTLNAANFVARLAAAKDDSGAAINLLRDLMRWLSNPTHLIWPELLTYLHNLIAEVIRTRGDGSGDPAVALVATSVLLHNTAVVDCPALADMIALLRWLTELGMASLLDRELVFEPLLHILRDDGLLAEKPALIHDVLTILHQCTWCGRMDPSHAAEETSDTDALMLQLITLGVIPTANHLALRLLAASDSEQGHVHLLTPLCLLYRNISTTYGHHLHKVGTPDILVRILATRRTDRPVVQATARALAKLVYDPDCLSSFQANTDFVRIAFAALEAQLQSASSSEDAELSLLVSRLCCAAARVAEGSPSQVDFLAQHGSSVLVMLMERYATPEGMAARQSMNGRLPDEVDEAEDLLRRVVWLVGLMAVSPHCPLWLVRTVVPPLLVLLKDVELCPRTHLTCMYILMCLSNLSYFFAAMEEEDAVNGEATLPALFATLGLILAGFLFEGNSEATVESARILGNMSFTIAGRDWMEDNRCDEVIVVFLGHEDLRIVYLCFGIILNLTAATSCRVVENAELLKMLLQHTGRYTRREDITAAAAREEQRLSVELGETGKILTEAEAEAAATLGAKGYSSEYAEQIADLVEKVLLNVRGLLCPPQSSNNCAAETEDAEDDE